jgi:ubiquinone/menaquinone biosynthesis C-methylase UbiE
VTIPREELNDRIRRYWDEDASTYDRSVGHGIEHPAAAAAWTAALAKHLPPPPANVLDVGAGTGAMSLLAAHLGHRVTAFDISPGMLAHAKRKASQHGLALTTVVGHAEEPPAGPFDAVVERHLLWTLPDPTCALESWRRVAVPGGRLVLYEGRWGRLGRAARTRRATAELARRFMQAGPDHHSAYDEDVLSALPLAGGIDVDAAVSTVERAGWTAPRVERLREVERAYRVASPPLLGWLESIPRFAVLAHADPTVDGGAVT